MRCSQQPRRISIRKRVASLTRELLFAEGPRIRIPVSPLKLAMLMTEIRFGARAHSHRSRARIHSRDALNGNVPCSVTIATLRSRYHPRLMTFAGVYAAVGRDDKSTLRNVPLQNGHLRLMPQNKVSLPSIRQIVQTNLLVL